MRISGITIPVTQVQDLSTAIRKKCGKKPTSWRILKRSIDARKTPVRFVYNLEVSFDGFPLPPIPRLSIPPKTSKHRPIIIGFGPCGMFAALMLAKSGLRPIVLERGKCIEERQNQSCLHWYNYQRTNERGLCSFRYWKLLYYTAYRLGGKADKTASCKYRGREYQSVYRGKTAEQG